MVFLHYFYFHCLKLLLNVLLVGVHKYGGKQVVLTVLGFMVRRCDYTGFFRRTMENPVAYVTS